MATAKQIAAAAAAIANARGMRNGVPLISNVLEALPVMLVVELMEDAKAALEAAEGTDADPS